MSTEPAAQPNSETTHPATDRRRHPRHHIEDVFTALGCVRDISTSGMRVRTELDPPLEIGEPFRVELKDDQRICLLPVRLVNTQPSGDGAATNLGLAFRKLTPAQQRTIDDLVQRGVPVETLSVAWQPEPPEDAVDEGDVYSAHDSFAGLALDADASDTDGAEALEQLADTAEQCVDLVEPFGPTDEAETDDNPDPAHREDAMDADTITIDPDEVVTARMTMAAGGDDEARDTQPGEVNHRRAGRVNADDATTSLGKVMDISANGLRVRRKGAAPVKVGSQFFIDLHAAGRTLRAPVEVVRIQKVGWRTFDYGLQFGELGDDVRAEFGRFCRMVSKCTEIH